MICTGEVLSIEDNTGGDNIYTFIGRIDENRNITTEKKTFPLFPKFLQSKPKKGETVILLTVEPSNGNEMPIQRFYIGPVISQRQHLYGEEGDGVLCTTNLGTTKPLRNISYNPNSDGCFGRDDEISLYGRGKSDIILGENNLRIRCGARLDDVDRFGNTFKFNTVDPAFMHMKYYPSPMKAKKIVWSDTKKELTKKETYVDSVATIAAQEINLVSTDNYNSQLTSGRTDMITDENMAYLIESLHPLPYGDKLVETLCALRDAINNHVHGWGPCMANKHPTDQMNKMNNIDFRKMLSENIRIG